MANVENVRSGEVDDDVVREFNQAVVLLNQLKVKFNALLTKMDADPTLAATDWTSTTAVTAADADSFYLGY
jgi:hypothetical protein